MIKRLQKKKQWTGEEKKKQKDEKAEAGIRENFELYFLEVKKYFNFHQSQFQRSLPAVVQQNVLSNYVKPGPKHGRKPGSENKD